MPPTDALQEDSQYHPEFNPPPDGSATGVGKQERVVPVDDPAHDQEQVQQRSVFTLVVIYLYIFSNMEKAVMI